MFLLTENFFDYINESFGRVPICFISKVTVIPVVQTEDSLYPFCTLQWLYPSCLLVKHCQLHGLLQAPIIPTESESLFKWGLSQCHSHRAFHGCWSLLTKTFLKTVIVGSLWVLLGNRLWAGKLHKIFSFLIFLNLWIPPLISSREVLTSLLH